MTAQLILPDVHHVTGGEILPFGESDHPSARSLRIWWWPVDGEWEQNDSVGLHGTDEFGPPADLVALTESCDVPLLARCPADCSPAWPCHVCGRPNFGGNAGTVPVARVTITLPPIKNWDRDANPCDDGPFIGIYQSNRKPAEFCSPHPDGSGDWTSKPLPFHVEPGQWIVRAEEVTS